VNGAPPTSSRVGRGINEAVTGNLPDWYFVTQCQRRMTFKNPMSITPNPPAKTVGEVCSHGLILSDNQQLGAIHMNFTPDWQATFNGVYQGAL